jgi:hypothetical protein
MKATGKMNSLSRGGVLGLIMLVLWASPGSAQTFTPTGSMSVTRVYHTAILLNNGTVLIVGGYPESGREPLASAELYDPATGTFSPTTGNMSTPRAQANAIRLNNGKVLISGGTNATEAIVSAELYDPATGIFTPTGSMNTSRYGATVSLLNSGKVLIAGGWTGLIEPVTGSPLNSAELYDPAAGTFSFTGSMTAFRCLHTAALLNNGKVLVAGGYEWPNALYLTSAELYDPGAGIFTAAGGMNAGREYPATVLLKNGKVLIAGGWNPSGVLVAAEVFDPAFDAFLATGSMNISRYGHTGTLLNDGKVLIAGGYNGNYPPMAEFYDPATGTFAFASNMNVPRSGHTATLLDNGKVLIAGGADSAGRFASAELYAPGPIFSFEGFFNPIDNPPILNKANAGQAIPVKWRVTDMDGQPVSDPASFVSITSYRVLCETLEAESANIVDEYAAGSLGLQYLGDGWWQFNWKTPKTYAGQCRIMKLTLSDQKEYTASFSFK